MPAPISRVYCTDKGRRFESARAHIILNMTMFGKKHMHEETSKPEPASEPVPTPSPVHNKKASNRLFIIIPIILIVIIITIIALNNRNSSPDKIETTAKYEITETDIFSPENLHTFKAEEVSVKGVMLGDTIEEVTKKIGYPDKQTTATSECVNMEYGKNFGLFDTGLIIQACADIVKKLTIRQPFNPLLQGKTRVIHTKEDIYHLVGKPDDTLFVPISPSSVIALRVIQYKNQGLEFFFRRDDEVGFVLTNTFLEKPGSNGQKEVKITPTTTG